MLPYFNFSFFFSHGVHSSFFDAFIVAVCLKMAKRKRSEDDHIFRLLSFWIIQLVSILYLYSAFFLPSLSTKHICLFAPVFFFFFFLFIYLFVLFCFNNTSFRITRTLTYIVITGFITEFPLSLHYCCIWFLFHFPDR